MITDLPDDVKAQSLVEKYRFWDLNLPKTVSCGMMKWHGPGGETRMSATNKAEAFMTEVDNKIRTLLREFSEGKLNSEQFHVIYERYANQRLLAQQAMLTGDAGVLRAAHDEQPTIAIKERYMGKALGIIILHNNTGAKIETLGTFDVSAFVISPVLAEFRRLYLDEKTIRPRVERLEDKRWLLFTVEPYTTVVTLFRNEPSPLQMREIQRLHHDFETANQVIFRQPGAPDARQLAYPFYSFVQRKLKQ
jgi:hypothetical protein